MHLAEIIARLEEIAPPGQAEEYDTGRIGLIVEGDQEIGAVSDCALDATPRVISEAVRTGSSLLVVHHTPIWDPLTIVTGSDAAFLRACLTSGLNVYVMHTNLDHAVPGINGSLAALLGLDDLQPMSLGVIGTCSLTPAEIALRLSEPVRVWGEAGGISRLAVVGGSGFDPLLLDEAAKAGADAFLSAEMKHAVARHLPLPCIEATHYSLETPGMRALAAGMGWRFIDDPPRTTIVP